MKIKKFFLFILCISCLSIMFVVLVYADNVTLYANIDDSSSQANLLVDFMRNDPNYDPYNEYCILRSGEREYRCYFGKSLNGSDLTLLQYTTSYQLIPAQLNRFTGRSLNINKNGYYYIGNVEGSSASNQVEQYKMGSILTMAAIAALFLILFRTFRKSEHKRMKFYNVR